MNKKIFLPVVFVFLGVNVPVSYAGTFLAEAPKPKVEQKKVLIAEEDPVEIRLADSEAEVEDSIQVPFLYETIEGYSDYIPYEMALKQLVPEGWKYTVPAASANKPVSWEGTFKVKDLIKHLAVQAGTAVKFHESGSEIVHYVYGLMPGRWLKSELERWGEIAGWKVSYQIEQDYKIESKSWFGSDFLTSIDLLEKAYKERGAMVDIAFKKTVNDGVSTNVLTIKPDYE